MALHVVLEVLLGGALVITDRTGEALLLGVDDPVSPVHAVIGKSLSTELAADLLGAVCQIDVTSQES